MWLFYSKVFFCEKKIFLEIFCIVCVLMLHFLIKNISATTCCHGTLEVKMPYQGIISTGVIFDYNGYFNGRIKQIHN